MTDAEREMETKRGSESATEAVVNSSAIIELPSELLFTIFSRLTLREIVICHSVCRLFRQTLTSTSFIPLASHIPPLPLFILRPSNHHNHSSSTLYALDPFRSHQLLRLPLDFMIPFRSKETTLTPVASSFGLLYLWSNPHSSIIVCNPLTLRFRFLLMLGSSWSLRHVTVLVGSPGEVVVFNHRSAIYFSQTFGRTSTDLPYRFRSPILVSDKIFALCDTGLRRQWTLVSGKKPQQFGRPAWETVEFGSWERVERHEWKAVFDSLEQPRLIRGRGNNEILMAGGLRSLQDATCSTFLILRLDLDRLEWDEVGRMPKKMFKCFKDSTKLKAFGGGDWVFFSGKCVQRLAMWNSSSLDWRWLHGVDGRRKSVRKGFLFDASLTSVPWSSTSS
ncbi:SKP1-interacting partner 15-like protein [Cinnamomum micranthum f. kanehirae]|uniref:SKP1-interacting partner 15-like protein n=1 Tax=Cinnamomum micranthum f. kanehirae TaxID=337451 RepID=A0A3S3MG03_9MAGN|nr:SKP1-interacting partner 15-like protein [Cinnamomum micranthum f. kanehirae]